MDWAAEKFEKENTKRRKMEKQSDVQGWTAKYKSFAWIVREEGGDPASFQASLNYCTAAALFQRKGMLWKGRPWSRFNTMKKRVEWLYVEEMYSGSYEKMYEEVLEEGFPDDGPSEVKDATEVPDATAEAVAIGGVPAVPGTGAAKPAKIPGQTAAEKQAAAKAAAKAKVKGKAKAKGQGRGAFDPEEATQKKAAMEANKQLAKEQATVFKNLTNLKTDMNDTINSYTDLMTSISNKDPTYAVLDQPKILQPLQASRASLEQSRTRNNFWQVWSSEFKFIEVLKKQFSHEMTKAQTLEHEPKLKGEVSDLREKVQNAKDAARKIRGNLNGTAI